MGVFQKARDSNGKVLNMMLLPLMTQQLQKAAKEGYSYQWAIVMAGINNLGAGNYTADQIMPKLIEAYSMVAETRANVVAIQPSPIDLQLATGAMSSKGSSLAALYSSMLLISTTTAAVMGQNSTYSNY
eukprot:GHRR01010443.1.p3 GENE.GHRR01010443.1~~GHRR01010443.1.p3  ORF type:complete len:129 (+),score=32.52 GHRR01010443.1:2901-3287(+)